MICQWREGMEMGKDEKREMNCYSLGMREETSFG